MRKQYFLTILSIFLGLVSYAQVSYTGNGNTGFGGTVGNSFLNINDDGTTITFEFSRGGGDLNDVLVIYVDSQSGGFADTSTFTDSASGARSAASTVNGGNDPTVTFPVGFTADFAIVVKNDFAETFELSTGSHTFLGSANLSPLNTANAATHTFTVGFSTLGITGTDKFDFVATYIAQSAWLSNEVIGDTSSIVEGSSATGSGNPGNDGSITFSDSRSYPNTWTGATSTDWLTASNWTEGLPDALEIVHIPAGLTNYPTVAGGSTILKGTIKSGATLIAQIFFSGTLTYERELATSNWYLVGAPVAGETIEDMINNNSFDMGQGSNIGLAPYDNTQAVGGDRWDYQTAASTGSLVSGGGYAVKLGSAGDLSFTGTMETDDVGVSISDQTATFSNGDAFNLVGNPYPSFLAANSNADATNNLLSINSSSLTEMTLWFWNQGNNSYDQINQMSSAFHIAPAQGFFVSSTTGSNTFNFTEAMQSHQSTDSFQRNANENVTSVFLEMTDGETTIDTEIYYADFVTTGWDNGYDSSIFSGFENTFTLYTEAVANGSGRKLGIQSLPNTELDNTVIPVGVIADAGEVTFSAEASNLPAGYKVFLEDKETGNFIRLDEQGSEYKVSFDAAVNGIGRFFLHTKTNALSTGSVDISNFSAYVSSPNNLRVVGIQNGITQVKLFNILGKQVVNTSFQANGVNDVVLPNLQQGVYIVQVASQEGTINKKIVIE